MENFKAYTEKEYKFGFKTDIEMDIAPKGLNEDIIRLISKKKNEPDWLLAFRLKAYKHWLKMTEPHWSEAPYDPIDYQQYHYWAAPKQAEKKKSLDEE